jgi:hypothetical protein
LHREIQRNSIFLHPDVRERLRRIDQLMWETLISREVSEEAGERKLWREAGKRLSDDIAPLKNEIEGLVQRRLGYEDVQ